MSGYSERGSTIFSQQGWAESRVRRRGFPCLQSDQCAESSIRGLSQSNITYVNLNLSILNLQMQCKMEHESLSFSQRGRGDTELQEIMRRRQQEVEGSTWDWLQSIRPSLMALFQHIFFSTLVHPTINSHPEEFRTDGPNNSNHYGSPVQPISFMTRTM